MWVMRTSVISSGCEAGRLQAGDDFSAIARAEQLPCPGVDENKLAPGIDHEGVDRNFDRVLDEVPLQKSVDFLLISA